MIDILQPVAVTIATSEVIEMILLKYVKRKKYPD